MPPAQDHKRLLDGDHGPNTGGMGAYAPAPVCPPELADQIVKTILQPTIDGLRAEGMPFTGVLYAGLILTKDGPKVLEYNCRFGDPETQVILPLLESDLAPILLACSQGKLSETAIRWRNQSCVCVVIASENYPQSGSSGLPITGLDKPVDNTVIFQAGTRNGGKPAGNQRRAGSGGNRLGRRPAPGPGKSLRGCREGIFSRHAVPQGYWRARHPAINPKFLIPMRSPG